MNHNLSNRVPSGIGMRRRLKTAVNKRKYYLLRNNMQTKKVSHINDVLF